ncbi:MAG: hypothetical protein AAF901_11155 [Bacteroidota bacterium]
MSIADSVALQFIRTLNTNGNDTSYVNVIYTDRFKEKGILAFSIYSFTRPDIELETLPFYYSRLGDNSDEQFVAFHFDDHSIVNKETVLSSLKKDSLIIDYKSQESAYDWFSVLGEENWHVFLCESDLSQMQLVKSFVTIEKEKPRKGLCRTFSE